MRFIVTHATALLYAGFWISLFAYGLVAPLDAADTVNCPLRGDGQRLGL